MVKKCPCCGSTATLYTNAQDYSVECSKCPLELRHEDRKICVVLWNRRAVEDITKSKNKCLKEEIKKLRKAFQKLQTKSNFEKNFKTKNHTLM